MPMSSALRIEDLEALPADGRRYELIGGAIVVTPAPEPVHQQALALRLVDGQYEPYVDTTDVAEIEWPVLATFRAGDLAQG